MSCSVCTAGALASATKACRSLPWLSPPNLLHYEKAVVFTLAAAYAAGIIKNHPFIDGNKRTGFMAAYTFLGRNGHHLEAAEPDATVATLSLAAGGIDQTTYAAWLRDNSKPIRKTHVVVKSKPRLPKGK